MKSKLSIIAFILVSVVFFYSFSFNEKSALEKVTEHYIVRNTSFKNAIIQFSQKVKDIPFTKNNLKAIRIDYFKLRTSYKKWEYLSEFIDPAFVKEYINGAPLQKMEANSFGPNIIEPKGLQVIDELLFSEDVLQSKESIIRALHDMSRAFDDQTLIKIFDRDVFIAARQGLVRLYTLGVTGFDTPGSLNGLEDSKHVIEAMAEDIPYYLTQLKNKTLADSTTKLLQRTISYLSLHQNFETFDRLAFLMKYINPLYKNLYEVHIQFGFEVPEEIMSKTQPVNYAATNLFDANFLKTIYYNRIPTDFNNEQTVELGRLLFYDPIFSKNNQRSCASCHNPTKGFTDQLPTSVAYGEKGYLKRNSQTLINAIYSEKFFHDLRAKSFEDQTEHVVSSPEEFNTTTTEILDKLNKSKAYTNLFNKTFKNTDSSIQFKYIQFALSAYVSSLQGLNSPFDKYVRGESKTISKSVKNGYNLFMGKAACGTCHYAPIFNGTVPPYFKESESEVLGVAKNPYAKKQTLDDDKGRGNSLLKERVEFYNYSFKTPTVRNVEYTFPYMHNGAYKTLEDVMDFYNNGGGKGLKIDVPTQTLGEDKLNLTKGEIADIISFMKALSDSSKITTKPMSLPKFENNDLLNSRKIGGVY